MRAATFSRRVGKTFVLVFAAALGFIFCMGSGAAYAASEEEPNDTFDDATPITIGEEMYGTCSSALNNDYFKLELPENGQVQVTFTNLKYIDSLNKVNCYVFNGYHEWVGDVDAWIDTTRPQTLVVGLKKGTNWLRVSGYKDASYSVKVSYYVTPTAITKLIPGSKSITAKWGKVTATGYQVKYSTSKSLSGAKTVTVAKNSSSAAIKDLKAKKKYYVKVRAYRVIDGKTYYSAWSAKKSVTTK